MNFKSTVTSEEVIEDTEEQYEESISKEEIKSDTNTSEKEEEDDEEDQYGEDQERYEDDGVSLTQVVNGEAPPEYYTSPTKTLKKWPRATKSPVLSVSKFKSTFTKSYENELLDDGFEKSYLKLDISDVKLVAHNGMEENEIKKQFQLKGIDEIPNLDNSYNVSKDGVPFTFLNKNNKHNLNGSKDIDTEVPVFKKVPKSLDKPKPISKKKATKAKNPETLPPPILTRSRLKNSLVGAEFGLSTILTRSRLKDSVLPNSGAQRLDQEQLQKELNELLKQSQQSQQSQQKQQIADSLPKKTKS